MRPMWRSEGRPPWADCVEVHAPWRITIETSRAQPLHEHPPSDAAIRLSRDPLRPADPSRMLPAPRQSWPHDLPSRREGTVLEDPVSPCAILGVRQTRRRQKPQHAIDPGAHTNERDEKSPLALLVQISCRDLKIDQTAPQLFTRIELCPPATSGVNHSCLYALTRQCCKRSTTWDFVGLSTWTSIQRRVRIINIKSSRSIDNKAVQ
jgi:hypothetical protein